MPQPTASGPSSKAATASEMKLLGPLSGTDEVNAD